MFIGTCLFSCALFSCGENSVLEEMDEDHNAGNCAKKVCDEHDNVHSGE